MTNVNTPPAPPAPPRSRRPRPLGQAAKEILRVTRDMQMTSAEAFLDVYAALAVCEPTPETKAAMQQAKDGVMRSFAGAQAHDFVMLDKLGDANDALEAYNDRRRVRVSLANGANGRAK